MKILLVCECTPLPADNRNQIQFSEEKKCVNDNKAASEESTNLYKEM